MAREVPHFRPFEGVMCQEWARYDDHRQRLRCEVCGFGQKVRDLYQLCGGCADEMRLDVDLMSFVCPGCGRCDRVDVLGSAN